MKIIIYIILLAGLFIGKPAFSQSTIVEAHFKSGPINFYDSFKTVFAKNKVEGCLISAVFAKFTIDTAGNVSKVNFSGNLTTPAPFKKLLNDVILMSNGLWVPRTVDGKKTESKPFILPLVFEMEAGCKQNTAPIETNSALMGMLNFGENLSSANSTGQLECILLDPLTMFSNK